jgi:hypothetical protein
MIDNGLDLVSSAKTSISARLVFFSYKHSIISVEMCCAVAKLITLRTTTLGGIVIKCTP